MDVSTGAQVKRTASVDSPQEAKRARHGSTGAAGVASGSARTDASKPIDKQYCDAVVNFLLRIACQVNFLVINHLCHTILMYKIELNKKPKE